MINPVNAIWGGVALPKNQSVWFDFSDEMTVIEVSGTVQSIADKNGNGKVASAPSAGARPVYTPNYRNGLSAAQFDGSFDLLISNFAQEDCEDLVWFVAAKHNRAGGLNEYVITIEGNTFFDNLQQLAFADSLIGDTVAGERFPNNNSVIIPAAQSDNMNSFSVISCLKSPTIQKARYNKLPYNFSGGGAATAFQKICLGARSDNAANGLVDIGEVIVYNRALTDEEIDQVTNYLIEKWAV